MSLPDPIYDDPHPPILASCPGNPKSLHWKQRLALRLWPESKVVGSRRLGEALGVDHETALALALQLEALGLVMITPVASHVRCK